MLVIDSTWPAMSSLLEVSGDGVSVQIRAMAVSSDKAISLRMWRLRHLRLMISILTAGVQERLSPYQCNERTLEEFPHESCRALYSWSSSCTSSRHFR
jgi:hypothetical protein